MVLGKEIASDPWNNEGAQFIHKWKQHIYEEG